MTFPAEQTAYKEGIVAEAQSFLPKAKDKPRKARVKLSSKSRALSNEDEEIVASLNIVKHELECLHNRYDNTSDELLVESIIYEIKAANVKYRYYLSLCKNKGIVSGVCV